MTITEQIRLKLNEVDLQLQNAFMCLDRNWPNACHGSIVLARRILREICELNGESEE